MMQDPEFVAMQTYFKAKDTENTGKVARQTIIEAFVLKKWQFLMTTTILERGITLVDLQVIIMQGDHPLFHERSLVQIAGRVGRKPQAPGGKVYVICHHIHQHILEANARIAFANEHL
jgi:competence protein ComFA